MREIFKSSSGVEFGVDSSNFDRLMFRDLGYALPIEDWMPVGQSVQNDSKHGFSLDSRLADALREFFQNECDEELGRWRDPDAMNYVAYPLGREFAGGARIVRVIDERVGFHVDVAERDKWDPKPFHNAEHTARRYFAAHPEPKPWHDAKPGECWAVTWPGAAQEECGLMVPDTGWPSAWECVETARRIWPEGKK